MSNRNLNRVVRFWSYVQLLNGTGSFVRGLVGVELLPGSTTLLDRATNSTVACTREHCPYGVEVAQPQVCAFLGHGVVCA